MTQKPAIAVLEAIPADTLQGTRELALMSVFFLTGCRVSAVTGACVGHPETDGVEHDLHVLIDDPFDPEGAGSVGEADRGGMAVRQPGVNPSGLFTRATRLQPELAGRPAECVICPKGRTDRPQNVNT